MVSAVLFECQCKGMKQDQDMREARTALYMTFVTLTLGSGFVAALCTWADRTLALATVGLCSVIWGS